MDDDTLHHEYGALNYVAVQQGKYIVRLSDRIKLLEEAFAAACEMRDEMAQRLTSRTDRIDAFDAIRQRILLTHPHDTCTLTTAGNNASGGE